MNVGSGHIVNGRTQRRYYFKKPPAHEPYVRHISRIRRTGDFFGIGRLLQCSDAHWRATHIVVALHATRHSDSEFALMLRLSVCELHGVLRVHTRPQRGVDKTARSDWRANSTTHRLKKKKKNIQIKYQKRKTKTKKTIESEMEFFFLFFRRGARRSAQQP